MRTGAGVEAVRKLGLPLSWEVIRVGWDGIGSERRLVSLEDVRSFADYVIGSAPGHQLPYVAELSMATLDSEVQESLARLAPHPSDRAARVWRAVLLDDLLARLPTSYVDILADLTSFWVSLGYPPDSPHVIQGRGNTISPKEYFTEERARRALEEHRIWLDAEITRLKEMTDVT